jgi:hypothetical protein
MKISLSTLRLASAAALALVSLSGCWNSSSNPTTLTLAVADAPVDGATSAVIEFTGVQIQGASGAPQEFDFSVPQDVDFLQLQDDEFNVLLDNIDFAPGTYQSVTLLVNMSNSSITLNDGSVHPLMLTGSDKTGVKVASAFTITSGEQSSFTVDFDLRKSITLVSGSYEFTPFLQFVDNLQAGAIEGTVSPALLIGSTAITDPACSPVAYIYAGAGVTPVDLNPTSKVQPVIITTVRFNSFFGDYEYDADFVNPGAYTVALVCAAGDNPATVDALTFSLTQTATVTTDNLTEVDF